MCYTIIPKQTFPGEIMKSAFLLLSLSLSLLLCSFDWEDITPSGGEVTFVGVAEDGRIFIENNDTSYYSINQGDTWELLELENKDNWDYNLFYVKSNGSIFAYFNHWYKSMYDNSEGGIIDIYEYDQENSSWAQHYFASYITTKIDNKKNPDILGGGWLEYLNPLYFSKYEDDIYICQSMKNKYEGISKLPKFFRLDTSYIGYDFFKIDFDTYGLKIDVRKENELQLFSFGNTRLKKKNLVSATETYLTRFDHSLITNDFIFLEELHYIINSNKGIFETTDGGNNWTNISEEKLTKLTYKNDTYLAINEKQQLVISKDKCVTWDVIYDEFPVLDMDFYLDVGYAVGTTNGFAISTDKGESWKNSFESFTTKKDWRVSYLPNNSLYAWNTIFTKVSYDKGLTWEHVTENTECFRNIKEDKNSVVHSHYDHIYRRSTDFGVTWSNPVQMPDSIEQMEIDSQGNVFLKIKSMIYSPNDTFDEFPLNGANSFFIGPEDILVRVKSNGGSNPIMETSADFGQSWTESSLPKQESTSITYFSDIEQTKFYSTFVADSMFHFCHWDGSQWQERYQMRQHYVQDHLFPTFNEKIYKIEKINVVKDSIFCKVSYIHNHATQPKTRSEGSFVRLNGSRYFPEYNTISIDENTNIYVGMFNDNEGDGILKSKQTLVGVEEELPAVSKELSVYPNPTSSTINVSFDQLGSHPSSIAIYNILGEKVMTFDASNYAVRQSIELNVEQLTVGIYFLKIEYDDHSQSAMFLKE
jgi:hypothetical protein